MKKIQQRAFLCVLVCLFLAFGMLLFLFRYFTEGDRWFIQDFNRHLYSDQRKLLSGTIEDANGVLLSYVKDGKRLFSEEASLRIANLHVVGDAEGKIGTSALAVYADYLVTYSAVGGASSLTEEGNLLTLTVDSRLNQAAYEALGGHTGTVALYNYRTGALLCLVSAPSYDPAQIPEDLESNSAYDGVYLNRFFSSTFRPGSVMKIVTLEAALSELPGVEERTFTCTGKLSLGDNVITCEQAHGTMNLSRALAKSCNCTFAALSAELGGETLQKYVRKAGFTSSYSIGSIRTAKGSFELATVSDYQLGWAGVGLYHDLINSCSLLIYYGAIANGGKSAVPSYLEKVTDKDGDIVYRHKTVMTETLVEPEIAKKLTDYMKNNCKVTYDLSRFPTAEIGAKSGTIETKTGKSNCWFAGFLTDEQMPYAFVVYMENAGSGNRVAGTVVAKLLHALYASE